MRKRRTDASTNVCCLWERVRPDEMEDEDVRAGLRTAPWRGYPNRNTEIG